MNHLFFLRTRCGHAAAGIVALALTTGCEGDPPSGVAVPREELVWTISASETDPNRTTAPPMLVGGDLTKVTFYLWLAESRSEPLGACYFNLSTRLRRAPEDLRWVGPVVNMIPPWLNAELCGGNADACRFQLAAPCETAPSVAASLDFYFDSEELFSLDLEVDFLPSDRRGGFFAITCEGDTVAARGVGLEVGPFSAREADAGRPR